ncbi:MAG TPA: FtsX-like permease family protein [Trebonia sp.]
MTWLGAVRTAAGGLLRHKVQTIVIGLVLLISTASATLSFALLAATNGPFDRAFAGQHGADVALILNTKTASESQIAATAKLSGVTVASGPFTLANVAQSEVDGQPYGGMRVAGRSNPGGPVDDLVLNAGHWVTGPGQIVLSGTPSPGGPQPVTVGSVLTVGTQKLTVVGFANSITNTADGWVEPSEAASLSAAATQGLPSTDEMLYQFASAGTYTQLNADIRKVQQTLPKGAISNQISWLDAQLQSEGNGAIMEPFVVAFAVIGLVMAVLIVGNVVSGAVAAQYHRIGVLKSIGMSPGQVIMVYLGRSIIPAVLGVVVGVVVGNILAVPLLKTSAGAYGVGSQSAPWWASVLAPLGMLAITLLSAFLPALRAGRLSATQAIAAGRAPKAGRGYFVHRLAGKLNLPRPVGIGLASPFARPARTAVTLVAIAFGATAVIFAIGLSSGLGRAAQAQTHSATAPVLIQENFGPGGNGPSPVSPNSGPPVPTAAQFAQLTSTLNAQPGTAHYVAEYNNPVKVQDISGSVNAFAYSGDASWIGWGIISGHWYDAPGQVDVNTAFLTQSGLSVGDTVTATIGRVVRGPVAVNPAALPHLTQATVKIVGEVFAPSKEPRIYANAQTLPGIATPDNLNQYYVGLKPGTNVAGYIQALNSKFGANGAWSASPEDGGQFYTIADTLISILALMVAIAAGLGVLNTVLMTTRDKVHDMGIFKALGMRPGQTLTMVVCQIIPPAVIAGAIAAPAAVALTTATIKAMAGTAHTGVPASFTQVFPPSRLALLSLAALLIAVVGALLPASWAARSRPATALRAE